MKYSYNYRLGLDDINSDYSAKNTTILRLLENTAGFHSDMVDFGIMSITKKHMAWALLDWELEIIEKPLYGMDIKVETWSRKFKKTYAYRDFEMYGDGKLLVKASSRWFLLDTDRRLPVRITQETIDVYQSEDISTLGIDEMNKIIPLESYESSMEYLTKKSDLDLVGHVHNIHYLDMVNECMSYDEIKHYKHYRINFRKEITGASPVTVKKQHQPDGRYCFSIDSIDGSETHCVIEID